MLKITIIKPGLYSTIQDGGRKGMMFYGFPRSGFMDYRSAQIANTIVGNKKNAACLEMIQVGMGLQFSKDATIAITGADMQLTLNGETCPLYATLKVKAGAILQMKSAEKGVIAYLAIKGKWQIPTVMNSVSTYAYAGIGGLNGTALKKKDAFYIDKYDKETPTLQWKERLNFSTIRTIKIKPGPEWNYLLKPESLIKQKFSKDANGDRMGVQLMSKQVAIKQDPSFKSQSIIPGMIQCTPAGKFIVILQDGQTTGGYPRVAFISRKQLALFNQLRPNQKFKFILKS